VGKTLLVLAVLGATLAATASGRSPRPLTLKASDAPHSVLAFQAGAQGDQRLVRVDARTLRARRGGSLVVTGHTLGWSYSPDGRWLALGDDSGGEVFLVDTRTLRLAGRVSAADFGQVFATAWVGDVLFAVAHQCCDSDTPYTKASYLLSMIDPERRHRINAWTLDGSIQGIARTRSALILLLAPEDALGPTQVAVVDPDGAMRTTTLDRIISGQANGRFARPGLAVDGAGSRAFVVGAQAPVAEVELSTLTVSYHDLSKPVSLLGRLRNWLEPEAEAKVPLSGPARDARWLGNGFLAVWGSDTEVTGQGRDMQIRDIPAGVKLIDTRSWTVRTLDPGASALAVAGETLLTYGASWSSATRKMSGVGLTAHAPTGAVLYRRFGSAPLYGVQPLGTRIAVQDTPRSYSVLDVETGEVLHRVKGTMPRLLVR
jgi:hypothetical protein